MSDLGDVPPRVLLLLYEQHLRDEAAQRLAVVTDLQAAIASAFGGEGAKAVADYKTALERASRSDGLTSNDSVKEISF